MTELKSALVDVRRAYRLLWGYQRRMMDLVQVIADGFDTQEFYAWSPISFARPTQLTTSPLKKWAWDGLPFYKASFLFKPVGGDPHNLKAGDWLLEIFLDSDDVDLDTTHGEPDASKFPDATTTSSQLKLVAWKCTEDVSANWFHDVWAKGSWPETDDEIAQQPNYPEITATSLTVSLDEISDREAVVALMNKFRAKVQSNLGISME